MTGSEDHRGSLRLVDLSEVSHARVAIIADLHRDRVPERRPSLAEAPYRAHRPRTPVDTLCRIDSSNPACCPLLAVWGQGFGFLNSSSCRGTSAEIVGSIPAGGIRSQR
jgi:hypothetical protein